MGSNPGVRCLHIIPFLLPNTSTPRVRATENMYIDRTHNKSIGSILIKKETVRNAEKNTTESL